MRFLALVKYKNHNHEWFCIINTSELYLEMYFCVGLSSPEHFPGTWSLKYVTIGTPGEFPDGADYSVVYKGRGQGYVIGYAAWEKTTDDKYKI